MSAQNKISGLILAGGLGRRMNQQDKGLINYKDRALVEYAISAIAPMVDELFISANRNQTVYAQFGYPVISDTEQNFAGPLSGILTAMERTSYEILLVTPCDSPLFKTVHLQELIKALTDNKDIVVPHDGVRIHPVFLALKTHLKNNLAAYLHSGERKVETWLISQRWSKVDFSDQAKIFTNINTESDLIELNNTIFDASK